MERLTSVLDAWAIVAWLRGESAYERVRQALDEGAICSWINLGEALYSETRQRGFEAASSAIDELETALAAEEPDADLVRAAAAIKVGGGISYADCFAVATAERHGLPLLTGDPEILALDRPKLKTIDLRAEGTGEEPDWTE